jgi:hypothetical protein
MSFSQTTDPSTEPQTNPEGLEGPQDQGGDSFSAEDLSDLEGQEAGSVVKADEAVDEVVDAAADVSAADAGAEASVSAEPVDHVWPDIGEDIDSVDLSGLPAPAQEWAGKMVARYKESMAAAEAAQADFAEAKEMFQRLVADIDDGNGKAVAEELEVFRGGYNTVASENVALANELFSLQNPDYAKAPPDLKRRFHDAVSHESFYSRWTDGTLAKKMSDAWAFEKSRAKWSAPSVAEQQRGGVVEVGTASGGRQEARIEDMSYRDILDRHDHLLS